MSTVQILDPIWLDPTTTAPSIVIETRGLIFEQHFLKVWGTDWSHEGSNKSTDNDPSGTPDVYKLSKFRQMTNKVLDVKVELINIRSSDEDYDIRIQLLQSDYEPDLIMHKKNTLGTEEGQMTEVFRVFAPLRIMS